MAAGLLPAASDERGDGRLRAGPSASAGRRSRTPRPRNSRRPSAETPAATTTAWDTTPVQRDLRAWGAISPRFTCPTLGFVHFVRPDLDRRYLCGVGPAAPGRASEHAAPAAMRTNSSSGPLCPRPTGLTGLAHLCNVISWIWKSGRSPRPIHGLSNE